MQEYNDIESLQEDFEDCAQKLAKLIARHSRAFERWDNYNSGSWSEELRLLDDINLADYGEVMDCLIYIPPRGNLYDRCQVLMNAYNDFKKWINR